MVINFNVLLLMAELMKLKVVRINGTAEQNKEVFLLDGSKMVILKKDTSHVQMVKNLTHIDTKIFLHFSLYLFI